MNRQALAKISILMCLSAAPFKIGYTANIAVPAWAYENIQDLANDGIVTLPPGITDVEKANFNRKDVALLVVKAVHSLNDKGVSDNTYQKGTDSSLVTVKAKALSDAVYELGKVSGRYESLVAEYASCEDKYKRYLLQMERRAKTLGSTSAARQPKMEEGYKITAEEFQTVARRMAELNSLKQSYQGSMGQLQSKKNAAEQDLQSAIQIQQSVGITEINRGSHDSDVVKVDALKVEFDKELRDLGMGASYVANSSAPSIEADADKRAEEAKYSYTGEARFSYADNSGAALAGYRQSWLRVRLYGAAKLNDDWTVRAMLESDKYFLSNGHGETNWVKLDRYYLHGLTGATTLDIGRFGYNIAEGNVYDTSFKGVSASVGNPIKYIFVAGQTDGNAETYGATAKYKSYDYDIETGIHQFGDDKWDSDSRTIAHVGINYYFDNFRLGAIYLHSDLADAAGNKEGYVGTFAYGRLKTWEKGTYEFQAKYYRQPVGTYITHTMNGLAGKLDGFKGLGLFFYYTLNPNVVAGIEYYRLRDLLSDEHGNTLWGHVSYYF
jgi:hypothetical protein